MNFRGDEGMSNIQKCYTDKVKVDAEKTACFCLTYAEWNKLKKKVDAEFDNGFGSYKECRFYVFPKELDFECHCILNRERNAQRGG